MRFHLIVFFMLPFVFVSAQSIPLFVGTYTGTGSKGIYVYRFDVVRGRAVPVFATDSAANPSFLALSPNGHFLYACNETASSEGGDVSAYRFDKGTGRLRLLNTQRTGGNHPCYVAVSNTGRWLLAGNYSGGSLTVFPLRGDGSIGPRKQLVQHVGGSVTERQMSPHVHATVFAPGGGQVMTPDLGKDKIMVYDFQPAGIPPLVPAKDSAVETPRGSGPRHLTFHPNGRWAYLVEELSGSVSVYAYKGKKLSFLQRVFTHTDTARGPFSSADVHVSPDGKFLYASNRGAENNLAIFRIDAKGGRLSMAGYQSTLGLTPRNFAIDPSGAWLLVANQNSDAVMVFKRNKKTGLLTDGGVRLSVPKPVCLVWGKR